MLLKVLQPGKELAREALMTYPDTRFAVESDYAYAGVDEPTGLGWFFTMADAVRLLG